MPGVTRRAVARLSLAAVLALGVAGCGDDADGPEKSSVGTTLTVYSSLPLQGPDADDALATVNGEKLALTEAGGRVGPFTIKYVSLDDSTAGSNGWDAKQASKNARAAAQDRTAIAYLGDFDSGATALTVPTLNEAGILQISPASTLVGLTKAVGADKGEPEKYYPAGTRTFGRVIAADDVQARAQIADQRAQGCRLTFLVHDNEAYGKSLTDLLELLAPPAGLPVSKVEAIDPDAKEYDDLVRKVTESGADCLFLGGIEEQAGVVLFTALHRALPRLQLFAPNGLATPLFARELGAGPASVTRLTSPGLPSRLYPPSGRAFLRKYRRQFGTAAGMYGMYGYEAMKLALLAVARAGDRGNDKASVVKAFFGIKDRRSILGTYSVDRGGDTSLDGYAVYRIQGGRLAFARRLEPAAR